MPEAATRTRYRFVTFIDSTVVEGGIYVWESVHPMPGDSRVEQVRCPKAWFWTPPDSCDRCEKPGLVHVGHEQEYGYDGLCDSCLDVLAEGKQNGWPIP